MKKLVLVAALFMFVCGGTFKTQQKWPNNSKHTTTKKPFPPCLFWETAFLIINC